MIRKHFVKQALVALHGYVVFKRGTFQPHSTTKLLYNERL